MVRDSVFSDRMTANQMLLDDPLKDLGRARPVPGTVRVDDRDRTLSANLEAIRFGSVDSALASQVQFNQASFQIRPRFKACIFRRAFWLGLITAEKYVPANIGNTQALHQFSKAFCWRRFSGHPHFSNIWIDDDAIMTYSKHRKRSCYDLPRLC